MSRFKRFLHTVLTYLAGNIFSKLVMFFLIPLYTNRLTTAEYGDYDVTVTIVTFLASAAFFQIWDGMFRLSFDVEKTEDKYTVISICFKGYLLGIALFSILYFVLAYILKFQLIILPFLLGISFGLQYMYSFATRVFLNNKLFVVSGAVNTFTIAAVNIVLIVFFHMGVQSFYIAQIAGALIQIVIIEVCLRLIPNMIGKRFDAETLKRVLRFSAPLCIATISYWLLSGFTKITINRVCGAEDNGLFAVANSLSNAVVIAVNVFQFAWTETAYLMAREDDRARTYKKSLDLLFCTVWICCAGLCSLLRIIYPFYIGEAFQSSSVIVPYLMIGVSAFAIAGVLGTLFMTEKKTTAIMTSTLIAAAMNISLSVFAARRFGLTGTVLVLTASYVLLMVLRLVQIKQKLNITISKLPVLSMIPALISVFMFQHGSGIGVNLLYLTVLVAVYILLFQNITGIRIGKLLKEKTAGR